MREGEKSNRKATRTARNNKKDSRLGFPFGLKRAVSTSGTGKKTESAWVFIFKNNTVRSCACGRVSSFLLQPRVICMRDVSTCVYAALRERRWEGREERTEKQETVRCVLKAPHNKQKLK